MSSPYVSVIIPVYKVQKYILQCLESIQKQSFTDYEVILVDDGSPDDSAKIISRFIADNGLANFHLLHKENGGVSSARNMGIRAARGQWLAFVDSDDWIEPDYLSRMVSAIEETDADYCLIGFRTYDDLTGEYEVWSDYPVYSGSLPEEMHLLTSFDYVHSRMYRKSIIDARNITFDEKIYCCEDNAFNFDYLPFARKFVCISDIGYNYRRNVSGSLTRTLNYPLKRANIVKHMEDFAAACSMDDIVSTLEKNRSFSRVMWHVLLVKVTCDILTGQAKSARQYVKTDLSRAIIASYHPTGKKDHVFYALLKHAFPCLVLLVRIYYSSYTKLHKFKRLFYFISH